MSEPTQLDRIESMLRRLLAQTAPRKPGEDEQVYRDPKEKYWQGDSYAGQRLSACPADYLRALARYKAACAWANRKEGDPAKAQYAAKDDKTAALATAWAEYREASGTDTQATATKQPTTQIEIPSGPDGADDIPF